MLSDPQLHYLDNAATSRVDPAVAQAVSEALTELWAAFWLTSASSPSNG